LTKNRKYVLEYDVNIFIVTCCIIFKIAGRFDQSSRRRDAFLIAPHSPSKLAQGRSMAGILADFEAEEKHSIGISDDFLKKNEIKSQ
jgi:hypothetical protein